jgi:hypothetical protein
MKLAVGDRPKASVCCAAEETELELLVVLDVVLFGWKGLGNSEETGLIVTLAYDANGRPMETVENIGWENMKVEASFCRSRILITRSEAGPRIDAIGRSLL